MELESFFDKNQIIFLKSTEKQLVVKEMVQYLEKIGHIDNPDRYYAQVIHRESLENTGIGKGVAIPHARTESVNSFVTVFGVSREGVDYQSFDGAPVHFVLLSIFPTEMSTMYLYLVGMIASIFTDDAKREAINAATTPAKLYAVLKKETKAYFARIAEKNIIKVSDSKALENIPSSNLDLLIRLDRLYHFYDEGNQTDQIKAKIEDLKKLVDNKSLTYYERMRKKLANPFAIVEKNNCTGCHMEIPPIYINQIKKKNNIFLCTHCGRFLIFI